MRAIDLRDTGRLLELHGQAVAKGLVTASEADRLRFVSAAEHATAIGKGNPPGLFAYLIRGRCWRYITQGDEDAARLRLREHLHGRLGTDHRLFDSAPRESPGFAATPAEGRRSPFRRETPGCMGLSADAVVVREVRASMIRAGIYRDPWPAFAAMHPGWDRGRWDRAVEDLGLS